MAVRRRRSAVRRTRVSTQTTVHVSSGGGNRLREAADVIADGIRAFSSTFSKKIPASVHVAQGSETTASVIADAPNAYPIETAARHPLFGNREYWYPMHRIRFMEEGASESLDEAAEVYGETIDDWLREIGW